MTDPNNIKSITTAFSPADTQHYSYPPTPEQALEIVKALAEKPGMALIIRKHRLN